MAVIGHATEPIKVLCVDDNADILLLLTKAIQAEADMACIAALRDSGELMRWIESHQPDVVLIDLSIPGVDAFDMIRRIRQQHEHVRAIVFSGHTDQESVDAALEAGAWGYVFKNTDLPRVIDAIRRVASGSVSLVC
jgi:DNA-binding NarL/FixJ family response regulator